jgi:CubicO group peptidase (beta-lactamase class C family)
MLNRYDSGAIAMMVAGTLLGWLMASRLLTSQVLAQDKAAAQATAEAASAEVSIEAFGHLNEFVRHKTGKSSVDPILTPLDSSDARFKKVPGLADGKGVSFESTNEPGKYLRHDGDRVFLTACPNPPDKQDATFLVLKGLAYDGDGWISLQPLSFPGHFLHIRNGELGTGPRHEGADFAVSATFRLDEPVSPRNPPTSGRNARGVHLFDAVMLKYGAKIGCTSAELAIARHGVVIIARGYGSSDRFGRVPMHPNNPMAIASCEKPITAAVIKQLARDGMLDLNASIFKVLKIQPAGPIADNRVWDITIQHILDHKSGWQGEPLDRAIEVAHASGFRENIPQVWLRFLMVQRLKDAPGTKEAYCNFGYDVLRLLIARTTGRPIADYVRHELCRPYGLRELREIQSPGAEIRGEPVQVWNARNVRYDFYPAMPSSPFRASAPALCVFMSRFWISGEPRDQGNWYFTFNGSSDNATSSMCQRVDDKLAEFDHTFIFNGRTEGARHDQIQAELKQVFQSLFGIR